MTAMKMKDLVRIHRRIRSMTPEQGMIFGDRIVSETWRIGEYMNEVSGKAQEVILEKADEKELVDAVNAMTATLVTGMLVQEGSVAPLELLLSDDIQPFTHTLILAVIGMLIDEEIL